MKTQSNEAALPPSSGSEDVWRSECCAAPIVIVRSDTSVFDYCSQEPSEKLEAELESHDVSEGSEFWMDDYVRIHHHACSKCRTFIGEPWIEETLDSERSLRGILMDLLAAKDEKDKHGDTPHYRALKADKWDAARRILFPQNAYSHETRQGD